MTVTFKTLHAHQQEALREWRRNVEAGKGQVGLWVYGARRAGTTSIALLAAESAMRVADLDTLQVITAHRLCGSIRQGWSADGVSRALPNDYDLYVEAQRAQDAVLSLWDADMLVVDDFHEETTDMPFWRKHVQAEINERMKVRKPLVVATDMAPNHPYLSGLQGFIEDLFVTCYAER
jgi:hypothetical protein